MAIRAWKRSAVTIANLHGGYKTACVTCWWVSSNTGLEEATENNASLFKWQAKLLEKFGIGSVVRVLTDRKTV